jgi:GTP-binding protein
MLTDEIDLKVKGGDGGDGIVSFAPRQGAGPDGGNGGNGGKVIAKAVNDIMVLRRYAPNKVYKAEDGKDGGKQKKTGANGKDLILEVPVGSSIKDEQTGQEVDLDCVGDTVVLAEGGLGGRGNWEFRSSTNTTPKQAEQGQQGQEREIHITLHLIADFGLIGLPSVGKSSLLNELTAAKVKTAQYPFTTLEPNLGELHGKILADIPGLIENASKGKGLGFKFLKHIEKVPVLLHCIAADSKVEQDYKTIMKEIEEFSPKLTEKPQIILLTKHDLVDDDQELKEKIKTMKKYHQTVLAVSIHDYDSIEKLKKIIKRY